MTAVRTLLTVVVAAALLGSSLPVVDDARADRTATRLDATATRLSDAAAALVATDDPVAVSEHGAGRTLVITLPRAGFTDARADYLSVGGTPTRPDESTVGYRVAGRPPRQVETSVAFVTGEEPLVLPPGRHRLRLTLVGTVNGAGVRVRPVGTDRTRTPTDRRSESSSRAAAE